uniref:Uncharacterized protein n=1 Tax=Rhizophora mucronata TaxID=61149 RepID=A0A2P2NWP8_RHIMU
MTFLLRKNVPFSQWNSYFYLVCILWLWKEIWVESCT